MLRLVGGLIVITFYCGSLDGSVHAIDVTVRPRMIDLSEAMLDAVPPAAHIELV